MDRGGSGYHDRGISVFTAGCDQRIGQRDQQRQPFRPRQNLRDKIKATWQENVADPIAAAWQEATQLGKSVYDAISWFVLASQLVAMAAGAMIAAGAAIATYYAHRAIKCREKQKNTRPRDSPRRRRKK